MNQSIIRLTRELSEIQKSSDLSIAVACRDVDVRNVRAVILGPPDTPYEFGFFEVGVPDNSELLSEFAFADLDVVLFSSP